MNQRDYNVEIPQEGKPWEGMGLLGSTPIAKVKNYRAMIEFFGGSDQTAKNIEDADCVKDSPEYEWYEESKHKETLVRRIVDCLLTGYELDRTIHFDNYGNAVYWLYGDPIIIITQADYLSLVEEAEVEAEKLWSELMQIAIDSYDPAPRLQETMDEIKYKCQGTSAKNIYRR